MIQADAITGVPTLSTFLFLLRLCAAARVQGVVAEISDEALRPPCAAGEGVQGVVAEISDEFPLHLCCCDKYLAENSLREEAFSSVLG